MYVTKNPRDLLFTSCTFSNFRGHLFAETKRVKSERNKRLVPLYSALI